MAPENGEKRGVTFKTLFSIAAAIVAFTAGIFWNALDARVKTAEAKIEQKVDKEEFIRTMEKIDRQYERIDTAIREHERSAARRSRD